MATVDRRVHAVVAGSVTAALACAALASGSTSHSDWPRITGALIINKTDSSRPIDMRVGMDPFGGADPLYRCDAVHLSQACFKSGKPQCADGSGARRCAAYTYVNPPDRLHNELLGGHGNDTIHAGPNGDVVWGDYKPSGQPSSQRDALYGGPARDVIHAGHGQNTIAAAGGNDYIKAHFGRGTIDCGAGRDIVYITKKIQKRYKLRACETTSRKTTGY